MIDLTVICVAVLASTASAAEKAIWGPVVLPDGQSAFPMYERLGVDTYQMQLNWDTVAPTRPANPANANDPAYRWPAELTTAGIQARRHGLRMAVLVTGAPGWANGARPSIWAPSDPADLAAFLTAAATRYSNVRRWMIWGEPNMAVRFQPQAFDSPTSARVYAPLLDAAYGALKRVHARNTVIGGMTWSGGDVRPSQFVREMKLSDGRRPRLDWFGHNPYPFRYPDLAREPIEGFRDISDMDTFLREIDAAYPAGEGAPVKLWLSEYMVQSDQRSAAFDTFVSQPDQAAWLSAGFRIAGRLGDRVAGIGWFTLLDQPPSPTSAHWGLLTSDLAQKPAWKAFHDAPSRRSAPRVTVPHTAQVGTMRGRGLAVRVRLREAGSHSVQLRRDERLVVLRRVTKSTRVRLRLRSVRRGDYTLRVTSPRGVPVVRTVTVR